MNTIDAGIGDLAQRLLDARNTVFFTGAGISTESGIPDFRSPGTGLWNTIKPIEFQDFVSSEEARHESWQRKFSSDVMSEAEPNLGHFAIQRWFASGCAGAVITQNVDNLHQNSGVAEAQIVELHGNATYASCLSCGARYELAQLREEFNRSSSVNPCSRCGGLLKTATISFGQAMPQRALMKATDAARSCDLFLVLGSSLVVYPAANLPLIAKDNGAVLVIINYQSTAFDTLADVVMYDEIGGVLGQVLDFS